MVALLAGGCAYYRIEPVAPDSLAAWGKTGPREGYIIYQPELYFAAGIQPASTRADAGPTVAVTPPRTVLLFRPIYDPAGRVRSFEEIGVPATP